MATDFQHRTRCLLAPGFLNEPEGKGTYILEITSDQFSLISKHWAGDYFDNQELVATSVRPNSTASYLVDTSGIQTIVCISTSSTLRTIRYDSDEEVWTDVNDIPALDVHPEGKIAAALDEHGRIRAFFQDPHGFLIHFNAQRKPIPLPVSPELGSPISIAVVKSKIHVFYISVRDHRLHYATETSVDNWTDHTFSNCLLIDDIKQFTVENTDNNKFEVYALTNSDSLVRLTCERKMSLLGKVDDAGKFTSERSIDHCCNDAGTGTLTEERFKSYLANDSHMITRAPVIAARADVNECYEEQNYIAPVMKAISVISDESLVHEPGASLSEENSDGRTAESLAEDVGVELRLVSSLPRKSTSEPNEWEKHIIDFIVALVMFLVQHFNYEDVFQEVMNEVAGTLDEKDSPKTASEDDEDFDYYI